MAKCCRRKRAAFVQFQLLRVNLFRYLIWPDIIKNANCRYFFRAGIGRRRAGSFSLWPPETLAKQRSSRFSGTIVMANDTF